MLYNPSKTTWLNPNIEYLFDNEIIEYDMSDAGFSLIRQFQLLPPEKITELERMGKGKERHIAVGKLQGQDREFSQKLLDKFAEMRSIFIGENGLTDDRIISVKKDAFFTIGKCNKFRFGSIVFAAKNSYTSYIRFPEATNLEIYYGPGKFDVKGIGEIAVNRHRLYTLEFVQEVIKLLESHNEKARRMVMDFIMKYKNHELDEEYYVRLDNASRDIDLLYNYQKIIIPLLQIIIKEL